jgi:RimJ/RimL family protein N-acetyltransferase
VTGPRDNEEVVGTGAYFLNPSTNLAEVAYMIVPELQGSGLGAALQQRLKEFGLAEVLQANAAMLNLAKRLGISTSRARTAPIR